jgi:hypothetical protein
MAKRHGKRHSENMKQQEGADGKEVRSSQTSAETTPKSCSARSHRGDVARPPLESLRQLWSYFVNVTTQQQPFLFALLFLELGAAAGGGAEFTTGAGACSSGCGCSMESTVANVVGTSFEGAAAKVMGGAA